LSKAIDIVARTLAGEARGCNILDQLAVLVVIRERVKRPGWWGTDWVSVCLKKYQFSCWLPTDPNYTVVVNPEREIPDIWPRMLNLARFAVEDMTERDRWDLFAEGWAPTHYHDKSIDTPKAWGDVTIVPTKWVSKFVFVQDVKGTPPEKKDNLLRY